MSDLERSLPFYEGALALRRHWRDDARVGLGAGREDVLVLQEDRSARPAGRHAGVYHVALLYPSRDELAHAALRLATTRTPIVGASDHGTHEAIYLPDPDGTELELAADRPREQWPSGEAMFAAGPQPLDLRALLAAAGDEPRERVEPGLAVGHVHLHVGDVDEAVRFYGGVLGFEEQMRLPTATFLSAGGYHHHVGANVWRGHGVPPSPDDAVGLRHWTIVLDDEDSVDEVARRVRDAGYPVEERADGVLVRDPWNIAVLVTTGTRARSG